MRRPDVSARPAAIILPSQKSNSMPIAAHRSASRFTIADSFPKCNPSFFVEGENENRQATGGACRFLSCPQGIAAVQDRGPAQRGGAFASYERLPQTTPWRRANVFRPGMFHSPGIQNLQVLLSGCRRAPGGGGRNAVRNGCCASPRKRLPSTPLRTGRSPHSFRHRRRSAPPRPGGLHRIWRHKVNGSEGTREGPLGGARQIRKKPCAARGSLHGSPAAP